MTTALDLAVARPRAADWQTRAACRDMEDVYDAIAEYGPDADPRDLDDAEAVCRSCLVRTECRGAAAERGEEFGMWGGVLAADLPVRDRYLDPAWRRGRVRTGFEIEDLTALERELRDGRGQGGVPVELATELVTRVREWAERSSATIKQVRKDYGITTSRWEQWRRIARTPGADALEDALVAS